DRMRSMRAFERALHTQWALEIQHTDGSDVAAVLTEQNDLYNALGVGTCTQVVVYQVRNSRIARLATTRVGYSGRAFPEALADLEHWLSTQNAVSDDRLMRNGHLLFTGDSADRLVPWLAAYSDAHAQRGSSAPRGRASPPPRPR